MKTKLSYWVHVAALSLMMLISSCGSEVSYKLSTMPEGVSFTGELSKVRYDEASKSLVVKGELTTSEFNALIALSNDAEYQNAVMRLFEWTNREEDSRIGLLRVTVEPLYESLFSSITAAFTTAYPKADIRLSPLQTDSALERIFSGDCRFALTVRRLTASDSLRIQEAKIAVNQIGYLKDAVCLAIHPTNPVNATDLSTLRESLKGNLKTWKEIASFGSSESPRFYVPNDFRKAFLKDSLLGGAEFGSSVIFLDTDEAILDSTQTNKHAVGFVSMLKIGNALDVRAATRDTTRFKIMGLTESKVIPAARPFQANVLLKKYPLAYTIYAVFRTDLGMLPAGYSQHLKGTREGEGQTLGFRAGLVPLAARIELKDPEAEKNAQEQ
ncbi:MAG: substrate-binding domain-containing protein [Chloroherpetonaceae bacterium]|nr:substrate-binding domain-containing protein [Chloroherpetonaceae bacterium]